MNQNRYAIVTHSLTSVPSRRDVLRGLAGAALGLGAARLPTRAEAKKKRKTKTKAKQPKAPKPNQYGCLNVGATCKNDEQCCSGVCAGQTCRAHHAGICRVDYDLCTTGAAHVCNIVGSGGITCACVLTTGNAPFCGETAAGYDCQECSQDADCEEEHGAGAACVVVGAGICGLCAETGGTACMAPCANPAK